MKKVRLTLKPSVDSWSFTLFDSPEAVYYLGTSAPEPTDEEYCCNVSLTSSDFLEVEWMGTEYVHPEENSVFYPEESESYDRIRLAKNYGLDSPAGAYGSGYIETYSGWVSRGTIPWNGKRHKQLKVTRINGRNKPKLDLSELFGDSEDENRGALDGPLN